MRIVISSPDHLGDFVLREPLFSALQDAGHALLLIVRDFVAPFARDVAPYAQVAACPGDPYAPDFRLDSPVGLELRNQVERFSADLLVIAPYQFTQLEQQVASWLPQVETIGLSGVLFQPVPHLTAPVTIRFTQRVQVSKETPEAIKNELLCRAILPGGAALRAPQLTPTAVGRKLAADHLKQLGLKPSSYWVVCAGDRPPLGFRNWEVEKWAELCRSLIERHNIRILFIGNREEHESTKAIQASMGQAARRTATITGGSNIVSELVGLIESSLGYLGKDTGSMHLAAALGKPVLGVFGGGTWPRFVPQAPAGAVFSLDMPCKSCDWRCRLQRSHCVKDVPVAPVLEAAERLILGHEDSFRVELLPRDGLLDAEIFRYMYQRTDETIKLRESELAKFTAMVDDRDRVIAANLARLEAVRQEAIAAGVAKTAAEVAARHRDLEEAGRRIHRLEIEVAVLTASARELREERSASALQLSESHARIADLKTQVDKLQSAAGTRTSERPIARPSTDSSAATAHSIPELEQENLAQSQLITQLQARIDTMESRQMGRTADLEKSLAQQRKEKDLALCLIPELRDELASCQRENAELRTGLRYFAERTGISDNDPRWLLEQAVDRLQIAEQQFREVIERLMQAAGERTTGASWQDRLTWLEQDAARGRAAEAQLSELTGELSNAGGGNDWRESLALLKAAVARGQTAEAKYSELTERLRGAAGGGDWCESLTLLEEEAERGRTAREQVAALTEKLALLEEEAARGREDGEQVTTLTEKLALLEKDAARGRAAEEQAVALTKQIAVLEKDSARGQAAEEEVAALSRKLVKLQKETEEQVAALTKKLALLEEEAAVGRAAQGQLDEVGKLLRIAAGENATGISWKEDLLLVENDRKVRLAKIEELALRTQWQEDVLVNRGEQIETLHIHIKKLESNISAVQSKLPYRALRVLRMI